MERKGVNIGITTYVDHPRNKRLNYFCNCVESIAKHTKVPYRLFIYDDCSFRGLHDLMKMYEEDGVITQYIRSNVRTGITMGFNTLWTVSEHYNEFYDTVEEHPYFCYLQDDTLIVQDGWLRILLECYELQGFHSDFRVGLFSGHDAPEHPTVLSKGMKLQDGREFVVSFKPSMRATNMIAPYEFWNKIGKIPRLDGDGQPRGFPGPRKEDGSRGRGSNLDIYITGHQSKGVFVPGAAGKNCTWNLGTYCMVVPGLVEHVAISKEDSTWGNPNKEE
jgi:hypothetical protein